MPWFRCLIQGENFPLSIDGAPDLYGFWTTRYVEADSEEAAETAALALLRADRDLTPFAGAGDPANAKVYFDEIEEVESPGVPNKGFTFYSMKDA